MVDAFSQLPSNRAELDTHVVEFESWFRVQQEAHGMEPGALTSIEHAILRSYITWLRDVRGKSPHAPDQAK